MKNNNNNIILFGVAFLFNFILASIISTDVAMAQNVSDIGVNVAESIAPLAPLVSGGAYILAAILGTIGVLKMKNHVESPQQTELKIPIIYLITGGMMFTLPYIFQVFQESVDDPGLTDFDPANGPLYALFSGLATLGRAPLQNINNVLGNLLISIENLSSLLSAVSYLLGLVIGANAIMKLKAHVEAPQQTGLREAVIRAVVSGLLFTMPLVYQAVYESVNGDGLGITGAASLPVIAGVTGGITLQAGGFSCIGVGVGVFGAFGGQTLGDVICNLFQNTLTFPGFFTIVAYVLGLFIGLWGLLKIQDHVINPQQTSVWEGVSRLAVAGGLFSLPTIVSVAYTAVATFILPHSDNAVQAGAPAGPAGLDVLLTRLMDDIYGPLAVIVQWFGLVVGIGFVFIGITRLMKSAQEGARGPGGIGTIMTFVIGGALISFSPMVTAISTSLFLNPLGTASQSDLIYEAGLTAPEVARVEAVANAIAKFVMALGLISIARGLFIIRGIAEGNSQASMMAAMTHLIGGGIAANLGPMINVVQDTLGIAGVGIAFN